MPGGPEPGEWRGPETLVLDAACLISIADRRKAVAALPSALILTLTPHLGEMAALLGCDACAVAANLPGAARQAAAVPKASARSAIWLANCPVSFPR